MRLSFIVCLLLVSVSLHAQLADFQLVNFRKADSIARAHQGEAVTDLPSLANKLTQDLTTEAEKFRSIYIWVCTNIEFDYETFRLNRERRDDFKTPEALRDWNKKMLPRVYRNLVLEKKTVCTGYAWLVQQLATHAGLSCAIVDGYGRTAQANNLVSGLPNHSWNAVKLNGKWYLCDATWSSGAYNANRDRFEPNLDLSFFLADPIVFVRNHYPLESKWTLLEQDQTSNPTFEQFTNGPLVYSNAYGHNLRNLSPALFNLRPEKGETVSFRFTSDQKVDAVELSVHADGKVNSFNPTVYQDETGRYCLDHTFANKGRQVVHVLLDKRYAFTYSVKVR